MKMQCHITVLKIYISYKKERKKNIYETYSAKLPNFRHLKKIKINNNNLNDSFLHFLTMIFRAPLLIHLDRGFKITIQISAKMHKWEEEFLRGSSHKM